MSASATATGLDSSGMSASVPAWLRSRALKARYAASKIWTKCLNGVEGDALVQGNIKSKGDRVTLQIFPTLSANDISTTDGSYTATEIVLTSATITINKWKSVAADIVDIVAAQSTLDYDAEFAEAFGKTIGQVQDDDVLALVASLTTNVTDDAGAFADAKVLFAQRQLDDLEVPKDDRTWGISPIAHADLLINPRFTEAANTGFAKGVQVDNGRVAALYGTPVVVTSRITTSSSGGTQRRNNVLFHKEAFGVVMQREFKMEKFMRQQFATPYAGSALYGVAILRDNHAARVQSAA